MQTMQINLEKAIRTHDFAGLRDAAEKLPPAEIANLFGKLSGEQQAPLFRVLPRKLAASTFEYLPLHEQEELLKALGAGRGRGDPQ